MSAAEASGAAETMALVILTTSAVTSWANLAELETIRPPHDLSQGTTNSAVLFELSTPIQLPAVS